MEDFFLHVYKSCTLETRASKCSWKKVTAILDDVADALGKDKAEELRRAINITREEEGVQSFLEGFRHGMTLLAERL